VKKEQDAERKEDQQNLDTKKTFNLHFDSLARLSTDLS
jgi:hypothetical protein